MISSVSETHASHVQLDIRGNRRRIDGNKHRCFIHAGFNVTKINNNPFGVTCYVRAHRLHAHPVTEIVKINTLSELIRASEKQAILSVAQCSSRKYSPIVNYLEKNYILLNNLPKKLKSSRPGYYVKQTQPNQLIETQ